MSHAQSFTVLAVGDVFLHKKLQRYGSIHGFTKIWPKVIPDIQSADIAYANLEGPIAENLLPTGREAKPSTSPEKSLYQLSYV